jgi:glycosyltransferase involved in cell wall biosynthesis
MPSTTQSGAGIVRRPVVSIVIRTCRGRALLLREALGSACAQTYRDVEILVVEDGSRDAEALVAEAASASDKPVRYLPIAKAGRCVAGNTGLQHATGELCQFLDDDDLLLPHHVATLAAALEATPACVAAYSLAWEVPTDFESLQPLVYRQRGRYVRYRQPFDRRLLVRRNYLPIQSVLFRRTLFLELGGLDPRLEQLEDWDLWRRYSARGDFRFVDQPTSLYRVPGKAADAYRRRLALAAYAPVVRQLWQDDPQRRALQQAAVGDDAAACRGHAPRRIRHRLRHMVQQAVLGSRWLYTAYWHAAHTYYRWFRG